MSPIERPIEDGIADASQTSTRSASFLDGTTESPKQALALAAEPQSNSTVLDQSIPKPSQHTPDTPWTPSTALETIPKHCQPVLPTSSPIPFFHLLERLKTTKREGWRRFGLDRGESISDHMYRMALMTMLAPPEIRAKVDVAHCTKMALVHDMAELLVGDITPVDGVSKAEKNRRETATVDYLCGQVLGAVDGGVSGEELRALWNEYEEGKTLESIFVHDIDKMELILQTVEYEKTHGGKIDLGEFTWVARRIALPEVQGWCDEVLREREEYWASLGKVPNGCEMALERERLQVEYYGNGHAPAAHSHETNGVNGV